MFVLSDMISRRISPSLTTSPSCFFHSMISPSCMSTPSFGIIISKAIYKIPRATRKRLKIRRPTRQLADVDGRSIFQAFRSGSVTPSGSPSPFYFKLYFPILSQLKQETHFTSETYHLTVARKLVSFIGHLDNSSLNLFNIWKNRLFQDTRIRYRHIFTC